jgi:hypothetical protein
MPVGLPGWLRKGMVDTPQYTQTHCNLEHAGVKNGGISPYLKYTTIEAHVMYDVVC